MGKNVVTIGHKGLEATTHCLITGKPLEDAPTNYSLGSGNYYVSVNKGHELSASHIAQISQEMLPHLFSEVEIEKEEEENDNWS